MKINNRESKQIDQWVQDFVTIMNGSTFTDNESYTSKLSDLTDSYFRHIYEKGKTSRTP